MTDRPIATVLGDLTSSELHEVAERCRSGEMNVWAWHLSEADRMALKHMRDVAGTATTHQERVGEDGMRLVARLLLVRGSAHMAPNRARIAQEAAGRFGARQWASETEKPLATPWKPVLARVPRSPKAWHPDDDLARAKLRLAASGGSLGVGELADAEGTVGASGVVDGDAA